MAIGPHVESMLTARCVKEVSELLNSSSQARRNWTCRGDEVTERGVVGGGGKMVSPLPVHTISST